MDFILIHINSVSVRIRGICQKTYKYLTDPYMLSRFVIDNIVCGLI